MRWWQRAWGWRVCGSGGYPGAMLPWFLTGLTAALLAANGAWLSHAVGRSEARALLMTLTTLHQLAVAIWLGGVIQLGLLWRFLRQRPHLKPLWPGLLKSFAWVGGPALLGVIATGVPLAWGYIGTWQGLIGTDYGAMVLVKVALLGAALVSPRSISAPLVFALPVMVLGVSFNACHITWKWRRCC